MVNDQRVWLTTQSKGDHMKGLHATQTKKIYIFFLDTSQGKSAKCFTLSVKDEEGNLFDLNDMKIEFVLEFL